MRRYALVSGLFFSVLTCVQLLRVVLRWRVTVEGLVIPVWASGIAALVVGSLAVWAFRAKEQRPLVQNALMALWLAFAALPLQAQGAPPQGGANQPYAMEYYYKTQWGRQQEFLQLFLKNHYPLLQKGVESGRMLSVKIETPANHMTEEARWDYRVTITFKNSTAATTADPEEESLIKKLYSDQETYTREEQRRFAILLAHWDLPVTDITPRKK